jgi:hypothetical protein
MGSFGKTALSGQIFMFLPSEKMGSFGNFQLLGLLRLEIRFLFCFLIFFVHFFKLLSRRQRSASVSTLPLRVVNSREQIHHLQRQLYTATQKTGIFNRNQYATIRISCTGAGLSFFSFFNIIILPVATGVHSFHETGDLYLRFINLLLEQFNFSCSLFCLLRLRLASSEDWPSINIAAYSSLPAVSSRWHKAEQKIVKCSRRI